VNGSEKFHMKFKYGVKILILIFALLITNTYYLRYQHNLNRNKTFFYSWYLNHPTTKIMTSNFSYNYWAYGVNLDKSVVNIELNCESYNKQCIFKWLNSLTYSKYLIFSITNRVNPECAKSYYKSMKINDILNLCRQSKLKIFQKLISCKIFKDYWYDGIYSYIVKVDLEKNLFNQLNCVTKS
jgi:hypothetical protein